MELLGRFACVDLVETTILRLASCFVPILSCLILLLVTVFPLAQAMTAVRGQMVLGGGSISSWEASVRRPSVIYDGSSFMMWYAGQSKSGDQNIGLATSTDGISWSRHALNPVLRTGSTWDAGSVEQPWVIYDEGSYKMWFIGRTSRGDPPRSLGYALSPDGIHWREFAGNPVFRAESSMYWPVVFIVASLYVMYYNDETDRTTVATSKDGIQWTMSSSPISIPRSTIGWDSGAQLVSSVVKNGNVYVLSYYGARPEALSPSEIGFANSTDGTSWYPYEGNPVITHGVTGEGNWDSTAFLPTTVTVGDKYYVYYTGCQISGGCQIGLAILPTSQYSIPEFVYAVPMVALVLIMSALLLKIRWLASPTSTR
jgi:hypothetical protein